MTSLDGRLRRSPAFPALDRAPTWLLAILLSLPLSVALISRLFTGYWWWNDFDAIACAGAQAAHGAPIYAVGGACAGLKPAAFVYAPMVARGTAVLLAVFSLTQLKALYVAAYIAASAWLGLTLFRAKAIAAPARDRIAGLGLITGGVIACGNVAILCHALVLAALLAFPRRRLPFIAAVALAAAIKPVFGTYLVVLLLDRAPLRDRAWQSLVGVLAAGAVIAASFLTAGPDAPAWKAALDKVVLLGRPGVGFLGWVAPLGLTGPAALAAYVPFAGLITLAAHRLTRQADLTPAQTVFVAVGVAQLLNPRLMGYDLQMLAPAAAILIAADTRLGLGPALGSRRALWTICVASAVLGCLSMVSVAAALAPPAIALAVIAAGLFVQRREAAAPAAKSGERTQSLAEAGQVQRLRPHNGRPELSLVICTLDEHACIARVIDELGAALAPISHEIIVVDDSADDRTAEAVLEVIARAGPDRVRLIRRSGVRGLASAAIAGWDAARGEVLGVMDGDGQHDPRKLREIYDRLIASGADVALVSRYADEDTGTGLSGYRDAISRIATQVTRIALGVRVTDPMSGQFVFHRAWYDEVRGRLSGVGFKILLDVIASGRAAPRTVEARGALRPRIAGQSKLDFRVMADLVALIIAKRTNGLLSARFALFAGVGALGVGVHLATLGAARLAGAPFWAAQGLAILTAMTSNFFLNNALTFRDARLAGAAMLKGLGFFYLSCAAGALISETLAVAIKTYTGAWVAAALAGAVVGAVVNYSLSRAFTWRIDAAKGQAGAEDALEALVCEIHLPATPSLALAVGQD